jgi:hypothetical protein
LIKPKRQFFERFNDSRGESHRRPGDGEGETLNNQLSTINCFNEERHVSEACTLALYEPPIKREANHPPYFVLPFFLLAFMIFHFIVMWIESTPGKIGTTGRFGIASKNIRPYEMIDMSWRACTGRSRPIGFATK